jgi:Rieske Fe-S protein
MDHSSTSSSDPGEPVIPRRNFFRWLTAAAGALASAVVGVPILGYILKPRRWPIEWVTLGQVQEFTPGETRMITFENPIRQPWDGMTAHTGVYVRNQGPEAEQKDQFLILAVNCAHLGCPVSWFPQSGLFMCPCHGGVYYANGERASGPPPRGLFHCVWRIRDGQLQVQAPHYPTLQNTLDQPA